MFSILKSKPSLAELIPKEFVDIHSHMLPGIDDGAKEMKDTQFLLESMLQLGFEKVITTPHTMSGVWANTPETITEAYHLVKKELPDLANKTKLQAASEYLLDENCIEAANKGELLTLKDNLVLVELSFISAPIQLYDYLFELQLKGYKPVLAHPERYAYFFNKKEEYARLKKAGCLFQLNLLATVGYYGKEVLETADFLLKNDGYDFAGSDMHHKKHLDAFHNKVLCKEKNKLENVMKQNIRFK
ncbi:histidinol phosphatase [Flavobacterium sp. HXWNR69]|uniref:protein-tyrosine-phosphatase n=1 Tax=Flavobacterium fragile TaxID=2949085 RepID=A0ABT0TFG2_9FLAO|nr:CpsB/CapC family capsule biosynthesis tyrosine phosphatase [Flavobacterium sp. HXWNR69]MCL9769720.1 histidinol phosphatase [Flavobacterium sp. HXWNR69]